MTLKTMVYGRILIFNLFMSSFRLFCLTCYLMLKMKKFFFCFEIDISDRRNIYINLMCDIKDH